MSILDRRLGKLEQQIFPKNKVYPKDVRDWTEEQLFEVMGLPVDATNEQIEALFMDEMRNHENA